MHIGHSLLSAMITQSNIRVEAVTTKHGKKMCSSLIHRTCINTHTHIMMAWRASSSTFSDGKHSTHLPQRHIIKHCNVVHNPNMSRSMLFVFLLPYFHLNFPVRKTFSLMLQIPSQDYFILWVFFSFSSHSLRKCDDDCWCFCVP